MKLWWAQMALCMAAGPRGGVAVRALCRLGGLRLAAERLDVDVELRRRGSMEDDGELEAVE